MKSLKDLYPNQCADRPSTPKFVGFWRPRQEYDLIAALKETFLQKSWMWPSDLVDPSWTFSKERAAVVEHLLAGKVCNAWLGYADCRLCGKQLGTCDMTDGVYVWPQKLEHYLIEHQVRLPDDFVKHVLSHAASPGR